MVGLTACSSGESGQAHSTGSTLTWSELEEADDPLALLWAEQRAAYESELTAAVQSCMTERGFGELFAESQALRQGSPTSEVAQFASGDIDPEAFAKAYGLGYAEAAKAVTIGRLQSPEERDPANRAFTGLSTSERVEYFEALLGADIALDEDGYPLEDNIEEPGGCEGQAISALDDGSGQVSFRTGAGLVDEIFWRFDSDPEVEALQVEWRRCMDDRGYSFLNQTAMHGQFSNAADNLELSYHPAETGAESATSDELIPKIEAQFDELRDKEIEAALDDLDCSEWISEEQHAIYRSHALDVIEAHQDELGIQGKR